MAGKTSCPGCISETVRFCNFILGKDIGQGCRYARCGVTLIFPLTLMCWPQTLKSCLGYISETVRCGKLKLGRIRIRVKLRRCKVATSWFDPHLVFGLSWWP